jgi:acyl transferase domain-containing protein
VFLEIGPDGTLSALGGEITDAPFIPLLRPGQPAAATVLAGLARAHVHGARVDWAAVLSAGQRAELPTYAFQHQRYWPQPLPAQAGDVTAAGLAAVGHPLLGAAVELAGDAGLVLTGLVSLGSQPWLADHVVAGTVLLPGTAFVEMAVQAGDAAGCGRIEELTLEAPLALPADGPVRIQAVAGPDENGQRTVHIYAQPGDAGGRGRWTRHASGRLGPAAPARAGPAEKFAQWPPQDAVPLDTGSLYEELASAGCRYGPVFRAVRAAWRHGPDIFAEVALPEDAAVSARQFAVHPALLDASLHAAGAQPGAAPDEVLLASRWTGMSLHAAGASALRVRLRPEPDGGLSVAAVDATGALVLSVDSVLSRPVSAGELPAPGAVRPGDLLTVTWVPLPAEEMAVGRWAVIGADQIGLAAAGDEVRAYPDLAAVTEAVAAGEPVPHGVVSWAGLASAATGDTAEAARETVGRVLELVQRWLADERLFSSRLVLVTRGAVAVRPEEGVADLAGAAVWGLVRSAQSENPGRLVLVDLPVAGSARGADVFGVLASVSGRGEPELAVRDTAAYGRRLMRQPDGPARPAHRPGGTALVTGGTGMLGGLVAGHLADTGRAGTLVLASRSGPAAPGVAVLAASLAAQGARVLVAACDTADPAALAGLLARLPADAPLRMVVHAAGVVDDGVIGSLTPDRVDAVMRPKADAAWHLHRLTVGADLDAFILFSSAAAAFGGSGQGNYAAANGFLDGLASYRRAAGLPATSMAWGLWAMASGISGHLTETDRARIARSGMGALGPEAGLALFDLALAADGPLLVPMHLDQRADPGQMPGLLRALVHPDARRAAEAGQARAGGSLLKERLAGASEADQRSIILDLVKAHVAAVLGYGSPGRIEAGREFHELGFDSLTAIELRNQLTSATGLRLSATLVFDHPTPVILAGHLRQEIMRDGVPLAAMALEEISKLERIIRGGAADNGARADLTIRVKGLLSLLERDRRTAAEDDDIETATAENIFALLDQELGEA